MSPCIRSPRLRHFLCQVSSAIFLRQAKAKLRKVSSAYHGMWIVLLGVIVLVSTVAVRFIPSAARIVRVPAAVFVAAEASFIPDGWRRLGQGSSWSFSPSRAGSP